MCSCEGGWTGKNCTINIDDCAVNPCQNNGTCIDLVAKYECRCKDGYTGIISFFAIFLVGHITRKIS